MSPARRVVVFPQGGPFGPTILTPSVPQGEVGVAYLFQMQATSGAPPYAWGAVGLPAGLAISSSGLISGTPSTTFGPSPVPITVTDSLGLPATGSFTFLIVPDPSITSTSPLPNGTVGTLYSFIFSASGGTPPYTWSLTAGGVPGLNLSASGVLSGTPTTSAIDSLTVVATDSVGKPSAPASFSLTISPAAGGYAFDHFISPTGNDANDGLTIATAWSSSAIANNAASYTVLGVSPGVYTRSTAAGNYVDYTNAHGTGPTGHSIPANKIIAACDVNKNYAPRTATFRHRKNGVTPLRNGVMFSIAPGGGATLDGIVVKGFGSNGLGAGTGNGNKVLNCEFGEGMSLNEQYNSSALSFSGTGGAGANNNYVYNTWVHNCQQISWLPVKVTGITTTGCTLVNPSTIPWDGIGVIGGQPSNTSSALWFLDTSQVITTVTYANGATTMVWPTTTITGTPSGECLIALNASVGSTPYSGNRSQLFWPLGQWGYYTEAVGLTTPQNVESCTFMQALSHGNKTSNACTNYTRTYVEHLNFAYKRNFAGSTFFTGTYTTAGNTCTVDHCIMVGLVDGFGQGSVNSANSNNGTVNLSNNTFYSRATSDYFSALFTLAISQTNPSVFNGWNNLFVVEQGAALNANLNVWAADSGTNFGTISLDHNVYYKGRFHHTNTPANAPGNIGSASDPGDPSYTLAQWQTNFVLDTVGSIDATAAPISEVTPFLGAPVQADASSFSINPASVTATAGRSGTIAGAMDGTLGKNGVAVGINFYPKNTDKFPRIGSYPIGSSYFNSQYNTAAFVSWAGKFNWMIYVWYIGIEPIPGGGPYTTFSALHAQQIANGTANGITSRPLMYVMMEEFAVPPTNSYAPKLSQAINTNNWWLRTSYPAGTILAGDFTGSGVVNICNGGPLDSGSGLDVNQYAATYFYNVITQGKAVSLYGEASNLAANSNVAGIFYDNQFWAPRSTMTGAWMWGTLSITYNNYSITMVQYQYGQQRAAAAIRDIFSPGTLVCGNSDYGTNWGFNTAGVSLGGQIALFDFVMFEQSIGLSSSIETSQGFAAWMNAVIAGEQTLVPGGVQMVMQVGRPGGVAWTATTAVQRQSNWTAADWQGLRYGEAAVLLRDSVYCLEDYNSSNAVLWWSDTWDKGGQGLGWLGLPTDTPQATAQFPNGVWGRHYQNGLVLVNPRGNAAGTQTITLPAGVYYTLPFNGFSDPTVNTHTQVNTVTLVAGDSRILAKSL